MKIHTTMPKLLRSFYRVELLQAKIAFDAKYFKQCWRHLERAHILGQPYPLEHTVVHWKMLRFGISIKNTKEIFGQIPRLLVGGVKSFVGKIPVGNTGGANVSPLQPMRMPADISIIIKNSKQ